MTQLSTFGGVVVPSATEAATIPADMLAIVNQLTGTATSPAKVSAIVTSKSERDANYAGYPAGGLVICPQAKTIWLSLGMSGSTQNWQTIYVDTGWVTAGFSLADNWTAYASNTVLVRHKGPVINLRLGVIWNSEDQIIAQAYNSATPGNITDNIVLTGMPSDFIPTETQVAPFSAPFTAGVASLSSSGVVALKSMYPSSKISNTQTVTMQFMWLAND